MPCVIESPTARIRVTAGVCTTGAGTDATGVELLELPVATMQESLFSQPQPSPSGSADAEEHIAGPLLPVVSEVEVSVLVVGGLAVEDVPTMQLSLFSHPQPSPSGSAAAEEHIACPPLVTVAFETTVEEAPVSTMQLLLFSHPQPSPSSSEVALRQIGSDASVAVELSSNSDAVRSCVRLLNVVISRLALIWA